jgi:hypothetical protein
MYAQASSTPTGPTAMPTSKMIPMNHSFLNSAYNTHSRSASHVHYDMGVGSLKSMRGNLKQQTLDTNGLYDWSNKYFMLDPATRELCILDEDPTVGAAPSSSSKMEPVKVSLSGARQAKEWSYASAIAGFGFDIIWTSGKIWSFLAENEANCVEWVGALNAAIRYADKPTGTPAQAYMPPAPPSALDRTQQPHYIHGGISAGDPAGQAQFAQTMDFSTRLPQQYQSRQSIQHPSQKPAAAPFGVNMSSIHGSDTYSQQSHHNEHTAQDVNSSPESAGLSSDEQYSQSLRSNVRDNSHIPNQLFTSNIDASNISKTQTFSSSSSASSANVAKEYESLRTRYQQLSDMMVDLKQQKDASLVHSYYNYVVL